MSVIARALCSTALLLMSATVSARMYQWVDPRSGTVQLSGAPPAWYRGAQAGPRVFVFERGRLVDDTAQAVEPAQAAALRASAFGEAPPATTTASARSPLRAPMFEAPPRPGDQRHAAGRNQHQRADRGVQGPARGLRPGPGGCRARCPGRRGRRRRAPGR